MIWLIFVALGAFLAVLAIAGIAILLMGRSGSSVESAGDEDLNYDGLDKDFRCRECGEILDDPYQESCPSCGAEFEEEFECPYCGEMIDTDTVRGLVCPNCGENLTREPAICPGCAAMVPAESTHCDVCGTDFWSAILIEKKKDRPFTPPPPREPEPKKEESSEEESE
jgi:rRNA maturation endonuclease Nob1